MINMGEWKDKGFYIWLQGELNQELRKIYKKVHRTRVFDDRYCIWILNNDDQITIPLSVMRHIYDSGKSINEVSAVIDAKYIARIKR